MLDSIWDRIIGGPERRAQVEEISGSINIPSQPQVMIDINLEFAKSDVDFEAVSNLVSRDVGMSAKLLKVANSPLFANKAKVESIEQALMLLGARQFKQTILASAFRQSMEGRSHVTPAFWSHSEGMGVLCDAIARHLVPEVADYAYLTGLFHDCAVPVLMERNRDYIRLGPRVLARDRSVFIDEEAECEIEHGSLGLVMTRSWSIPLPIVKVIRAHHSDEFSAHNDPTATYLHVILAIAENFYLFTQSQDDEIFGDARNKVLLASIMATTGWSQYQILSLAQLLEKKVKG